MLQFIIFIPYNTRPLSMKDFLKDVFRSSSKYSYPHLEILPSPEFFEIVIERPQLASDRQYTLIYSDVICQHPYLHSKYLVQHFHVWFILQCYLSSHLSGHRPLSLARHCSTNGSQCLYLLSVELWGQGSSISCLYSFN